MEARAPLLVKPCCQCPEDFKTGSASGIILLNGPSTGAATFTLATSVSISLDAGDAVPELEFLTSVVGLRSGVSDLIVDVKLV